MVACERCGRGEGEWRCQVCGKVVCENCARPTDKGVFCIDHVPIERSTGEIREKRKPGPGAQVMKSLFMVMLALTLGLGLIVIIGDFFVNMIGIPSVDGGYGQNILDLIVRVKGSGTLIVMGMVVITVLLGIGYIAARRRA